MEENKNSQINFKELNDLLKDLWKPCPSIYWCDLLLSSLVGWLAFYFLINSTETGLQAIFYFFSVLFLFRGLFFIHEISHHSSGEGFRWFTLIWNGLIGIPLLVPSFLYEGTHLDHHKRGKYGTMADPEYLPFAHYHLNHLLLVLISPFFLPLLFAIRALVLAPIGLVIPRFHRWIETHLSALVINDKYLRRELLLSERRSMKLIESATLVFWIPIIGAGFGGFMRMDFFFQLYLVNSGIGLINFLRTLVAHRYLNRGTEMTYQEQWLDSVNVNGGYLTELWAPVGARFHAVHHLFPRLPYHSLPEAHRRLLDYFGENAAYGATNEKSFYSAFKSLLIASGAKQLDKNSSSRSLSTT